MNATVMTTGPGVIIATATASRNLSSFNQPKSLTTPPYRNGMIAKPLPNTNAPALVKNQPICQRTSVFELAVAETSAAKGSAQQPGIVDERLRNLGGVFTSHARMPAPKKSHTTSDWVTIVAVKLATKISHSNQSLPIVRFVSL